MILGILTLIVSIISLIVAFHLLLATYVSAWETEQIYLARNGLDRDPEPWYVRYMYWIGL